MPVRTAQLWGPVQVPTTPGIVLATVPVGERWIVKNVRLVNTSADPNTFRAGLDPLSPATAWFWENNIGGYGIVQDSTWQVFDAGDELVMEADVGATLTCWGSGTRLEL